MWRREGIEVGKAVRRAPSKRSRPVTVLQDPRPRGILGGASAATPAPSRCPTATLPGWSPRPKRGRKMPSAGKRDRVTSRQPASPELIAAFVALPHREYHLGSKQHYHPDGGKQRFLSRSLRIRGQLLQPRRWGAGMLAPLRKNVVLLAAQAAKSTEPSIPQGSGYPRQRPSAITPWSKKDARNSAISKSSGVSMSWTRFLGRKTGRDPGMTVLPCRRNESTLTQ